MLITNLRGPAPPRPDTPVDLLAACHTRIRAFSQLAERLEDPDASSAARSEAAGQVHRYFAVALPLHIADEERSIEPRLADAGPALAVALAEVAEEHREIDALLAELLPFWQRLAAGEAELPPAPLRRRFADLMERHLLHEERALFPAVAALPPPAAAQILEEMRARRR